MDEQESQRLRLEYINKYLNESMGGGMVPTPSQPQSFMGRFTDAAVSDFAAPFQLAGSLLTTNPITSAQNIAQGIGNMGVREYGRMGGALGGAAIGASLGSVVPVVGTAIGGLAGAAIGGLGGEYAGNMFELDPQRREWDWAQELGESAGGAIFDVATAGAGRVLSRAGDAMGETAKHLGRGVNDVMDRGVDAVRHVGNVIDETIGGLPTKDYPAFVRRAFGMEMGTQTSSGLMRGRNFRSRALAARGATQQGVIEKALTTDILQNGKPLRDRFREIADMLGDGPELEMAQKIAQNQGGVGTLVDDLIRDIKGINDNVGIQGTVYQDIIDSFDGVSASSLDDVAKKAQIVDDVFRRRRAEIDPEIGRSRWSDQWHQSLVDAGNSASHAVRKQKTLGDLIRYRSQVNLELREAKQFDLGTLAKDVSGDPSALQNSIRIDALKTELEATDAIMQEFVMSNPKLAEKWVNFSELYEGLEQLSDGLASIKSETGSASAIGGGSLIGTVKSLRDGVAAFLQGDLKGATAQQGLRDFRDYFRHAGGLMPLGKPYVRDSSMYQLAADTAMGALDKALSPGASLGTKMGTAVGALGGAMAAQSVPLPGATLAGAYLGGKYGATAGDALAGPISSVVGAVPRAMQATGGALQASGRLGLGQQAGQMQRLGEERLAPMPAQSLSQPGQIPPPGAMFAPPAPPGGVQPFPGFLQGMGGAPAVEPTPQGNVLGLAPTPTPASAGVPPPPPTPGAAPPPIPLPPAVDFSNGVPRSVETFDMRAQLALLSSMEGDGRQPIMIELVKKYQQAAKTNDVYKKRFLLSDMSRIAPELFEPGQGIDGYVLDPAEQQHILSMLEAGVRSGAIGSETLAAQRAAFADKYNGQVVPVSPPKQTSVSSFFLNGGGGVGYDY